MSYLLYLDDERYPKTDRNWIIVRNIEEFQAVILAQGSPKEMSLDHDLGEREPTSFDCMKWYIEQVQEGRLSLPEAINVHSANPVGAANIRGLVASWIKFTKK